jgi:AsmA protein
VELKDLELRPSAAPDLFAALSFSGGFTCAQLKTNNFMAENAKSRVTATHGVLTFDPVALQIFGGHGGGRVVADFTGATPVYHLRATVEKLQLAEFSKTVKVANIAKGELDFSTELTLRGTPKVPLMRTANGQASLRGTDLELEIGDLDKELSRYESTQSFNLLDLGAFFLAGPLGVAVTKGYDYARILKRAPGATNIRSLISRWQVEEGVAHAQDVALATPANRIAMHGSIDFVAHTYEDVTVALLSPQGCARVEQKIHGSFDNPVIDRPSVISTLTGPVHHLIDNSKSLLGAKCPVFYSGSVPSPG